MGLLSGIMTFEGIIKEFSAGYPTIFQQTYFITARLPGLHIILFCKAQISDFDGAWLSELNGHVGKSVFSCKVNRLTVL